MVVARLEAVPCPTAAKRRISSSLSSSDLAQGLAFLEDDLFLAPPPAVRTGGGGGGGWGGCGGAGLCPSSLAAAAGVYVQAHRACDRGVSPSNTGPANVDLTLAMRSFCA